MSDTSGSEKQVTFIAAAAVLVALPLLVMFGLAAIALVTQAGANAEMKWLAWSLFFAWVVLVVTAVLVFAVRFVRRSS